MEARRVFGADTRILATSYLALATWLLGNVENARRLIERAIREGRASEHIVTIVQVYVFGTMLEGSRDDPAATQLAAEPAFEYAAHGMGVYAAFGEIYSGWARGRLLDPEAGARELQQALAAYLEQGNKIIAPWSYGMMAELEALAGRADSALASVAAGLALAKKTGERWMDPLLFRRKGEILLERDRANPALAEEAFRTAIVIAQQQGSRSFGLRAALSLSKLYQSTGRPVEAHAVLAPALEGFSPTPEMPEIAEAQALLERLAHGVDGAVVDGPADS